jgi:hypothetical protein
MSRAAILFTLPRDRFHGTALARRVGMKNRFVGVGAATAAVVWTMAMAGAYAAADDDSGSAPAEPDLSLKTPSPVAETAAAAVTGEAPAATVEVAPGFYRDRQGRVMQVSFDFGRRLWLGVGYAPRLHASGTTEIAPAAFDFGAAWDALSEDGRTRHRLRILDGQVRLHGFGMDVTAFRYDMSHRYEHALLRITTFGATPARHDLFLNVGFFTEALHFETAPRGIEGEHALTIGSVQATLDLWQSADLRSYVRLRTGPGLQVRTGPWGETTRFVGFLPQAVLEGNLLVGSRGLQQLAFRARACLMRTVELLPEPLPGGYFADAEAAYEAILLAINDQPVSFRIAAQGGVRGDAAGTPTVSSVVTPGWEWRGTAGFRMSFLSPPLVRR